MRVENKVLKQDFLDFQELVQEILRQNKLLSDAIVSIMKSNEPIDKAKLAATLTEATPSQEFMDKFGMKGAL